MILHTKIHTVQSLYILFLKKINEYIRKYDKTRYLALFIQKNLMEHLIELVI